MKNFTLLFFLLMSSFVYAQVNLPIDFEMTPITTDFIDFDGGMATVISNPQSSGINTSATVAQIVRDGGQPWSGSKLTLANNLDFSSNNTFTIKVFSPAAGIPVLLKLEGPGAAAPDNVVNTTVANEWETLTWNYTGTPSNTYNQLVFMFDFGTVGNGTASSTFLFDDVEFFDASGGLAQVDLPVTFDDAATVYYDLIDFEGAGPSAIVVDPTDPNNMVAEVLKSNTAGSSAGTTMGGVGFSNPIPFSAGNTTMSVRVWSPDAGIQVRLKVEDSGNNGISVETEATTTVAMAWDTLVFDFANEATGTATINFASTYNKASIFFNFGVEGATAGDKTYYWDDVQFGGVSVPTEGIVLPVDFESSTITYAFGNFNGGDLTLQDNPDQSGINTSAKVARMIKNAGEPWGGSFFDLESPVDLSINKTFKMKVWAPAVGTKVLLKIENLVDGGIFFEKEELTTAANAWEEMSFDFSAASTTASYQRVVIIFENGTVGDGSAAFTYYIDDLELVAGGNNPLAQVDLPITFEDTLTINYALGDFGGNSSEIVVDPTDPSNLVVKATKTDVAEVWAGTTAGGNGLATAIPFEATGTLMNVRVWSPDAGIPILLKAEAANDPTISVETVAMTTIAGAWETLQFDFSNEATGTAALDITKTYDKISIFFNFGTNGATAGEKTYYFDDVYFGPLTGIEIFNAADSGIKISPNPTNTFFNIEFPEMLNESVIMMLFDVNGKLVKKEQIIDQVSRINVDDLNGGMYFLKMNREGVSYFQKVMITK